MLEEEEEEYRPHLSGTVPLPPDRQTDQARASVINENEEYTKKIKIRRIMRD